MWALSWNLHAFTKGLNPFFTHHLNAPDGVNLLWDTSIPLPSLLVAPFTAILGPVFSYNLLATAAPTLSAFCAYLCCRRYVRREIAAAAGGLLYGFSPYVLAHVRGGHLNLALALTPPLMFVLLDEILVRQRHRPALVGGALGLLAGAQLLVSQEILATEAVTAAVGVTVLAVLYPREVRARVPYAVRSLGIAFAAFAVLAAVPVAAALLSSRRPRHGALYAPDYFVNDLYGLVVPTRLQQFRPRSADQVTARFTDSCCIHESHAYLGVPLLAVAAVAAVRHWSAAVVRFATVLAATMLVLSFGPHLHVGGRVTSVPLPQTWLASVPLLENMFPSRLTMYVYLLGGLLAAVLLDRARPRSAWWLGTTVGVALALTALFPRVPFPVTRAVVPAFFASGDVRRITPGSIVLVAPFARDTTTSMPMLWQATADMRFRVLAGYATGADNRGRFTYLPVASPLSTLMESVQRGTPPPPLTPEERAELRAELRARQVGTVVVGPFDHRAPMVELFTAVLGRPPEQTGGVDVWWDLR